MLLTKVTADSISWIYNPFWHYSPNIGRDHCKEKHAQQRVEGDAINHFFFSQAQLRNTLFFHFLVFPFIPYFLLVCVLFSKLLLLKKWCWIQMSPLLINLRTNIIWQTQLIMGTPKSTYILMLGKQLTFTGVCTMAWSCVLLLVCSKKTSNVDNGFN